MPAATIMSQTERISLFLISALTCLLIYMASYSGLAVPGFYAKETVNWQAQSVGQDMVNLFLATPFLLVSAFLVLLKKDYGFPLWAGCVLYLIYTYLIYCFNIHFNNYFLCYCCILGICFYLLFYFMQGYVREGISTDSKRGVEKVIGLYFLIVSLLFCFLWLSDIVPAVMNNTIPKNLVDGGLVTNPVQVLDLSIFLPGVFIAGILLLKGQKLGYLLAPVLLTFFILMDSTIGLLTIIMIQKGVGTDLTVSFLMGSMALFSSLLLVLYFRKTKNIQ